MIYVENIFILLKLHFRTGYIPTMSTRHAVFPQYVAQPLLRISLECITVNHTPARILAQYLSKLTLERNVSTKQKLFKKSE